MHFAALSCAQSSRINILSRQNPTAQTFRKFCSEENAPALCGFPPSVYFYGCFLLLDPISSQALRDSKHCALLVAPEMNAGAGSSLQLCLGVSASLAQLVGQGPLLRPVGATGRLPLVSAQNLHKASALEPLSGPRWEGAFPRLHLQVAPGPVGWIARKGHSREAEVLT